jgi:ribosomal protein L11 methyltransferase
MKQICFVSRAEKPVLDALAQRFDPIAEENGWPASLFETVQDSGDWTYSIYVGEEDVTELRAMLAGEDGLKIDEEQVEQIDWVAATLEQLAPVRAGRFLVHGSHDAALASAAPVPVQIDAGLAFGTGHHGTTAGCLDMLERVLRMESGSGMPAAALDVGTGSGVLAIAYAKALRRQVLASDIDPVCARVARENAKINGVGGLVKSITATGFGHPAFASFGKADLVFANILARPLERLSRDLARHCTPGAWVILSGLLPHQRARLVAAYRRQGLLLVHSHYRDGWLTLLMKRP